MEALQCWCHVKPVARMSLETCALMLCEAWCHVWPVALVLRFVLTGCVGRLGTCFRKPQTSRAASQEWNPVHWWVGQHTLTKMNDSFWSNVLWSVLFLVSGSSYLEPNPCFCLSFCLCQFFESSLKTFLFLKPFSSVPLPRDVCGWVCVCVCILNLCCEHMYT